MPWSPSEAGHCLAQRTFAVLLESRRERLLRMSSVIVSLAACSERE